MIWPTLYAGERVTLRVPNVRDAATDSALDLDAATAIEWQLRRTLRRPGVSDDDDANPVILTKELGDGITVDGADVAIAIDSEDTVDLMGKYYADLWVTIAGKPWLVAGPWPIVVNLVVNPQEPEP